MQNNIEQATLTDIVYLWYSCDSLRQKASVSNNS